MNDYRPDPDVLLAAIQKGEARERRGKLKIFFGMAAGVGKTYAMLDAARQRRSEGVDVVVGYIETHKRAETETLLEGLEVVPRQQVEYRDTKLAEMDVDAIIARHPQLALVDELAHTNAPGLRHAKRYQDVIELLEAGIDVYTTVNVQHFESRADAVRQITGIQVHETVPDSILDYADEIELIDLSPDDLRKRLAEGKVYTPERIDVAANNFFRVGNLTALREMALRLTAEQVDHQLQDYMQVKQIAGPWKSGDRLMVAVSASPFSEKLIRWTRRMAYNLEAAWLAVFIETSETLAPEAKAQLAHNLTLARGLGAEVITAAGDDVADALLRVARQRNVTQIVVGKPLHSRFGEFVRGGSMVNRLVSVSGDVDIYVVKGDDPEHQSSSWTVGRYIPQPQVHSSLRQYLLAVSIVAAFTAVDLVLFSQISWVGYQVVGLTELLAVLLIAVYIGRGPALAAAFASAISWNFLFINPRFTFRVSEAHDVILLLLYFLIAIFAGNLTARLRTRERQARYNADRSMALYALAHETATAINMNDVLRTAVTQIASVFDADLGILLLEGDRLAQDYHPSSTLKMDAKDRSVAQWVFEHGKPAGRFTDTLPQSPVHYIPLRTPNRIVGVIGVRLRGDSHLSYDQEVLLETFTSQIALVIERELLDEAAEQAAMLRESERLFATLLNSISHELRTPIAAITGAASSLRNPQTVNNEPARGELLANIEDASERLNRLVENLLDMSRLESGRLKLKLDWCDVGEIIGVAVKRLEGSLGERPVNIAIDPDLPLIRADFVLLEQVLINLLDNACNYTPIGTPIEIEAHQRARQLEVSIRDHGPGIPEADIERVFDKFYRAPGTAAGGTGLGLSICRGIVEAHEGKLTADNARDGGARFTILLPLNGEPPPVQEVNHG
ncbi:MAG: sensor histidine kinase KdpD [Anaerolineae bacterium]|nr:sensor histidine kinase KdpD [Anaerolineae bacterium]